MTRLYSDRGFAARNWASTAILIVAMAWGILEIVRAKMGISDESGYFFGAGFLAAAAYGGYRMLADARDTIFRLEADFGSGQSVVTLWRPWGMQRLAAPLDALTGWRMYIAIKTRQHRTYLLRVDHPANPGRPLHIELRPAVTPLDGLRQVAPEAIADFEMNTGGRKSA